MVSRLPLFLIFLLALVACADSPPLADKASQVNTIQGDVIGFASDHDTYAWRGIPYAKPPLGPLRWKAPRAPAKRDAILNALSHGAVCVQMPNPTAGPVEQTEENIVGSEDCLTLNIYSPRAALDDGRKRPVMFWIHGGGNMAGAAQVFDGSRLASTQDVVVVTINYRLGLLGWLRHGALRATADNALDASGNFGSLDIIEALNWVQANIGNFGGDAGSVTVFGESAGGRNTWGLVQSPLAKGLFHRAIVQSGSLKIMDPEKSEKHDPAASDYAQYQNNSAEVVGRLLGESGRDETLPEAAIADTLRRFSASEIFAAAELHPQGMYEQPRLFLDGTVFTAPALELFKDPERYNSVPIITGTNRDEDKLFFMFDDRWVSFRLGFLPKVMDQGHFDAAAGYAADYWRLYSVDVPAQVITGNGGAPVYTYRFDFDDHINWPLDLDNLLGAAHAMEIPFVFGSTKSFPWSLLIEDDEGADALSTAMMNYWGEFARTGKPGTGGNDAQPEWTAWKAKGNHIMRFDSPNDEGLGMSEMRQSAASLQARLRDDPHFTQSERCEAYRLLFLNGYQVRDGYDENAWRNFGAGGCGS